MRRGSRAYPIDLLDLLVIVGTVLAAAGATWATGKPGAGLVIVGLAVAVIGLLGARRR